MKRIIHKYLLKDGKLFYLCNQAVSANWKKTDIAWRRITCKNCKKTIKGCKK